MRKVSKSYTAENVAYINRVVEEFEANGKFKVEAFREIAERLGITWQYAKWIYHVQLTKLPNQPKPELIVNNTKSADPSSLVTQFTALIEDYQKQKDYIQQLETKLAEYVDMQADYDAMLRLMEHARKATFVTQEKPRFKMDINGNLERVN